MLWMLLQCCIVKVMQIKLTVFAFAVVGLSNGRRSFTIKHTSKKRISIRNFELKFGMLDYWPSTITKSKKQENVKISSQ